MYVIVREDGDYDWQEHVNLYVVETESRAKELVEILRKQKNDSDALKELWLKFHNEHPEVKDFFKNPHGDYSILTENVYSFTKKEGYLDFRKIGDKIFDPRKNRFSYGTHTYDYEEIDILA